MHSYKGNAISWELVDGVIELALHREPCNEMGTLFLSELERLTAALPSFEESAHALIIYSRLACGFSAGGDLPNHACLRARHCIRRWLRTGPHLRHDHRR